MCRVLNTFQVFISKTEQVTEGYFMKYDQSRLRSLEVKYGISLEYKRKKWKSIIKACFNVIFPRYEDFQNLSLSDVIRAYSLHFNTPSTNCC